MSASIMLFAGGMSTGMVLGLVSITLLHRWRTRSMAWRQENTKQPADGTARRVRTIPPWIGWLGYRSALVLALIVVYGMYATFAIAQPTLEHLDPVIFAALQASLLLPIGLALLGWTWRSSTRTSVRLGFIGGIPLGLAFLGVALALHTLGIVPSALLTALEGLMASLLSWLVFRQSLSVLTLLAAGCASGGAALLWWIAPSHWQTDLIALACGLLFTLYAFHVEHHAIARGSWRLHLLPFFGGLFLSMAMTAVILALWFGRWDSLLALTRTDLGVVLYCGLATLLIPQVLLTLLLRRVSAVSLAFCAVLEPLFSIGYASLWGTIALPVAGWCGVALILLSLLIQAGANCQTRPQAEGEPS